MYMDTIAAISTPMGEGGISVIRVSGAESIKYIAPIFKSKTCLTRAHSHTIHYGFMMDKDSNEIIDEVLVSVMHAPRSFTTENTIEISCHGGILITNQVLQSVLDQGIRLAEPGEFTKRAFLNGRIDLSQAEAVIDLIRSKSNRYTKVALKQVEGALSKEIKNMRHQLLELMAHIEVNIDYPEHDVQDMTQELINDTVINTLEHTNKLIQYAEQGKILREGILTAIVGKPNVGKSSLLNHFARENRAIVSDIPGTTRDVIEQYVTIGGIPLKLLDTAGIRETSDVIEKIGVQRSMEAIEESNLILLVLNNNEELMDEDISLLNNLVDRSIIILINKVDLTRNINLAYIHSKFSKEYVLEISLANNFGLDLIEKAILNLFFNGKIESDDLTYMGNVRHIQLLKYAKQSLLDAIIANESHIPIDIIQLDIRNAWEHLGEITGETVSESLIDQIFSQFCLGK
jgi:tRNA modification GTPase